MAARICSVNLGTATATEFSDVGVTGIDKQPSAVAVHLSPPGPRGTGGSGLTGDDVCDLRHHGGDDQAVYAFAHEDYAYWQPELTRSVRPGLFGENLTTIGLDINDSFLGDRWQIGDSGLELEVTTPRIPCRTFAGHLGEAGWVKRFTVHGRPGTYLRITRPGTVAAGDLLRVVPGPRLISVADLFRALTTRPELLGVLSGATGLPDKLARKVERLAR